MQKQNLKIINCLLSIITICLFIPSLLFADKLSRPPDNIIGIGASPCADYVSTYEAMQRIKNNEEKDPGTIVGVFGAYGDFTGTFGGFFASSMMQHGDRKIPFISGDHAMSHIYEICKQNPKTRFIDVVYVMSNTAYGRKVKWK